MSGSFRNVSVPLSKLVPGKLNPRRVKPERDSHRKLVASIRSHGLIDPLLVRAAGDSDKYIIIAGKRRYAALREIHKGEDPRVACRLREADEQVALSLSLAENYARSAMHPLDEAEAFSSLATGKGKDAKGIAAEFGVSEHYVRQRIKLASLAPAVKAAYREAKIDTAVAEAFTSVPEDQQIKLWEGLGHCPLHPQRVRNLIANEWMDGGAALFDISTLPENVVSRDLFNEKVLIERSAFMEAQSQALLAEKEALTEEGWSNVVIGPRQNLCTETSRMDPAKQEYDAKTTRKLEKLSEREAKLEGIEIEEGDGATAEKIGARLELLDDARRAMLDAAPVFHSEATKAVGTVFLMLSGDGSVQREYRVPRVRQGVNGHTGDNGEVAAVHEIKPPTSFDLSDRQKSAVFTHHTLAVREALLEDEKARKRVLATLLHDKVRSEALAVRPDTNGVTLAATREEGFASPVYDRLAEARRKVDPLTEIRHLTDELAYEQISKLSAAKLDKLIDILIVDCLTCHALRPTPLVHRLARELGVDFRKHWRPDAKWLGSFQKAQLSHLMRELYGALYDPSRENRKKSQLVDILAGLFTDAAEGKLADEALAERVNRWLPANLRPVETPDGK